MNKALKGKIITETPSGIIPVPAVLASAIMLSLSFWPVAHAQITPDNVAVFQLNPGKTTTRPIGYLYGKLAQLVVPAQPANNIPENPEQDGLGSRSFENFDSTSVHPVTLGQIIIQGNQRISQGRILQFFNLKVGDTIDSGIVNAGLQRLFRSGLFENFSADLNQQGVLTINVVENPIINRVAFEGNKTIKDELLASTIVSRSRLAYSVSTIDKDVRSISAAYRQSGRYAAAVKPVIIKRDQNRVDVVFEIDEGTKTTVKSINFVGNYFASDGILRDQMLTKRDDMVSFLFGGDSYDPDKLSFDTERIRNYYLKNGFADFRIISAASELDVAREGFHITITMDEGSRYTFGNVQLESQITEVDTVLTQAEALEIGQGSYFDNTLIQKTSLRIENSVQEQGIPFLRVVPKVVKNSEDRIIDVTFDITSGPRRYIELINIKNNVRTLDYVIRRELLIAEGDPISNEKIKRSKQRLLALGYFKSVDIIQRQGTFANDTILDVNVEEKSTGSISAGVGVSTSSGTFARVGLSENNFLGRGQKIQALFSGGKDKQNLSLSFTEPRFMERDLAATIAMSSQSDDSALGRSYDYSDQNLNFIFGQQLFENLTHISSIGFSSNDIENVVDSASPVIKDLAGTVNRLNLSQSLRYKQPQYSIGGVVTYSGLIDSYNTVKTELSAQYVWPLSEGSEIKLNGKLGYLKPLGDTNARVTENFRMGGERDFRGFSFGGIGPKISGDDEILGGQKIAKGSINYRFPSGLPGHVGLDLFVFSDFGILRDHGLDPTVVSSNNITVQESDKMRLSAGFGMQFTSLLPISMFFAKPIMYEDWDNQETFVLSLGATF